MSKLACAPIAAFATLFITFYVFDLSHSPFILASLGGSSVIVFGAPASEMARLRSLVGGHFLSSLVGLFFLHVLGDSHMVMAAATATAFAVMLLTRTVHSPAGSDPLIIISTKASWGFLLHPLAVGILLLLAGAYLFNLIWHSKSPAQSTVDCVLASVSTKAPGLGESINAERLQLVTTTPLEGSGHIV